MSKINDGPFAVTGSLLSAFVSCWPQMTSAVTTTVIGEGKIVGLLVLSALLLGAHIGMWHVKQTLS